MDRVEGLPDTAKSGEVVCGCVELCELHVCDGEGASGNFRQ